MRLTQEILAKAQRDLFEIEGVVGVGRGVVEDSIDVSVLDADALLRVPATFEEVPLYVSVTGPFIPYVTMFPVGWGSSED